MTVTGVAEDDSKKVYNINVVVMPEYKGNFHLYQELKL